MPEVFPKLTTMCDPDDWFEINDIDDNTKRVTIKPEKRDIGGITRLVTVVAIKKMTADMGGSFEKMHNTATLIENEELNADPVNIGLVQIEGVDYNIKAYSQLTIKTDTFNVDMYGNTDMIKDLIVTGTIGSMRLGFQLPNDYIPTKKEFITIKISYMKTN